MNLSRIKRIFMYPLNEIRRRSVFAVFLAVMLVAVIMFTTTGLVAFFVEEAHPGEEGTYIYHRINYQYGMGYFYTNVTEIDVFEGSVPQYNLPVDPDLVANFHILDSFNVPNAVKDTLLENGFVVTFCVFDELALTDFSEYYNSIPEGVPRFITSDMILHIYHSLYASLLMYNEISYFIPWLNCTFKELLNNALSLYEYNMTSSDVVNEAILRLIAYLIVPLSLLDPNYSLPTGVPEISVQLANAELSKIYSHSEMTNSPIMLHIEDYTQYIPRGYYTLNKTLSRYFLSAMYLGRMFFPIYNAVNSTFADVTTVMAFLLTNLVLNTFVKANGEEMSAFEIYEKIYYITAFFVGYSDDLTFNDYKVVMENVFGQTASTNDLADPTKLHNAQSILESIDKSRISAVGARDRRTEIGLRFLGQRFILDSYIFQKLVYPEVPTRFFPKSLDIPATFNFSRARVHLSDELNATPKYKESLDNVTAEISELNITDWTWNLYNGWLYTLNATLKEEYPGYPTFMQTDAWLDEKLVTFLGSWTELRHDTILYAKQSYTRVTAAPSEFEKEGYVEPLPLLWSRLKGLVLQTKTGLETLGVLTQFYKEKLDAFSEELNFLLNVTLKELQNIELTDDEKSEIYYFNSWLDWIMEGIDSVHQKTTLVADVHTDPNSGMVLEEAVGYIHLLTVIYPTPSGALKIAMGPVFSYYEFKQNMEQRLTDEAWAQMLESESGVPPYPSWTSSYLVAP